MQKDICRTILLDGIDIREYNYDEYIKVFSPVFQDFMLFAFSVNENIAIKEGNELDDLEEERIVQLVRQTGLEDILEKFPQGLESILFKYFDENGVEPSGGEQQKIALARALYKDAPVVILDEPTSALDPIAEYEIYKHFNELIEKKTALYISHRLSSCRFCNHIAVFSDGRIAEYGTHDELMKIANKKYFESNGDCVEEDNFYPWIAIDEDDNVVGHFIMRYTNGNTRQLRFGWVY